jgi:hypothetical protein
MVPTQLEYSCDCESTEQLLKTGRNPNVLQKPWKRNEAVLRCKSGEENGLMAIMGCNINNYRSDARETIVFKVAYLLFVKFCFAKNGQKK